MTFLDVGQGDAAVVECPSGKVVVIDGGGKPGTDETAGGDPGNQVVVPYLRSRGISTVDVLVATHADDDHAQGLNAVAGRLTVRAALINGFPGTSKPYNRLLARLRSRRVPLDIARRGQTLSLGDGVRLQVLSPTDKAILYGRSASNNQSIVLRVIYGKSRFLFTGDAEEEEEKDMLSTKQISLEADVLKIGHHGSRGSSQATFLDAVHPSVAVISAGRKNNFGHPHPEVLSRLRQRGVRVFRTDQQGAITIETDGKQLSIKSVY
ncbi:MAG: ComEC/Rec2 family competence protein [Armatimonadota bacterium]